MRGNVEKKNREFQDFEAPRSNSELFRVERGDTEKRSRVKKRRGSKKRGEPKINLFRRVASRDHVDQGRKFGGQRVEKRREGDRLGKSREEEKGGTGQRGKLKKI